MKFILTGCTGFIGSEVLSQCLRNPTITSVVALSRRKLPDSVANDPKLKLVIMKDFNLYSESALKEISGADACIWCMGTTAGDKVLEVDYPLAFGNAFSPTPKKKFRYIYLSGATTERDQEKPLWFKADMRKMKGQAEQNMLDFVTTEGTKGLWETLIVKSGFVISKDIRSPRDIMGWMMGMKACIRVDELAATMIDAALNGWRENTLKDVQAMGIRGREILGRS
ncbi:hypothetical protein L207DRAFT_627146 [Hyaloscypha variabilis F]|uniref:NAD(P)-binding domain-containing protein n=1 Tax=Hyaloscypha variabilis (strain UAMH 11265 / GT02V1 / F) TaxID=1149755 RepID=A0A2J6SCC5_HYAVF|nr:hypothetical protein L207DRAFT_627146 [Hyaloscypha variabilis F]